MAITVPVQSQHQRVIPVVGLYNMLMSHWEGIHGLKSAQVHCFLQIYLSLLLVDPFLYSMLSHGYFLYSMLGWVMEKDLIHSTDIAVHLKQRPPICVEIKSALFAFPVGHSLRYSLSFRACHPCLSPLSLLPSLICQTQHFTLRFISKENRWFTNMFDQPFLLGFVGFQHSDLWTPRVLQQSGHPSGSPLSRQLYNLNEWASPSHFHTFPKPGPQTSRLKTSVS